MSGIGAKTGARGRLPPHPIQRLTFYSPLSLSHFSMWSAISLLLVSWNIKWLLPIIPAFGRSTTVCCGAETEHQAALITKKTKLKRRYVNCKNLFSRKFFDAGYGFFVFG